MATPATYKIRGTASHVSAPRTDAVTVTTRRRVVLGSRRDTSVGEVNVARDEVARVELENGFVLWMRADDLIRERGTRTSSRDGSGEAWTLDTRPPTRDLSSGTSRGWMGLGIKVLEFFGLDLHEKTARVLGTQLEEKQLGGNAPGLYRCSLEGEFQLTPLSAEQELPAGQGPLLVFIHGTGSSGMGSFGKLWQQDFGAGTGARRAFKEEYGDRVFCFEHRTLTESPIANALALARVLPPHTELHLVSHSRGGLVGELLCLGERDRSTDPLKPDLLQRLFAADRTIADQFGLSPLDIRAKEERDATYDADRRALAELLDLLDDRRFAVRRFVRVACPARGTTLASGRLDRWLSVLDYLTGNGLFGDAVDFLLAVIKERTDPRTLPGLEAMMPGSALTRLLHHPDLQVTADLSVIAGDIEGDSIWSQLKLLALDWFYGAEHDLVVNTGSMYGGIRRPPQGARFLWDQGPEVNHFNYFAHGKSVNWLLAGLTRGDSDDGGFQPLQAAKHEQPRWRSAVRRSRADTRPRPLAVLLPGAMGSELHADGEEIWLHYWRLLRGGLKRLRIDAPAVEATEALDSFYGPLIEFLATTHRVEVFAYDWRHSIRDAATKLVRQLEDWLPPAERAGQPVHLVAHSMGGLVVRAMMADRQRGAVAWRRITALANSRLLMLGTPNRGSHESMRWLTGTNPTQRKLSLLDLTQDRDDIIGIVREYPGLLELLPFPTAEVDFAEPALWHGLKNAIDATWDPPREASLGQARNTWTLLEDTAVDTEHMVYVAGNQPATVADYRIEPYDEPHLRERKRLSFLATREGDGTVTWQSGRLPGVKTWFVADTAHDELCTQQRAFPGYLDLLMTGRTTRLPNQPPGTRRGAGETADREAPMPLAPFTDDIPDEHASRSFGFGPSRPLRAETPGSTTPAVTVSIRHGDLAYARHPVVVGHYLGDTVVNAEERLDRRLGGALTRRLRLGLYPGPLNTHAVFCNDDPNAKPAGAIVVGLGQVGELSPGLLESGFCNALLDYALQLAQQPDGQAGAGTAVRSAAITCLLVGTGAGGIPLRSALAAMLRGVVAANERLRGAELTGRVLIDKIEFIELHEDVAIAAGKAMENLLRDGTLADTVVWPDPIVQEGDGRLRRVEFEEPPAWWHRLEIVQDDKARVLRFIATTQRARAEETLVAGQMRLADAFIAQASRTTTANPEVAKTLFEMLLPLRLKELASREYDLVLLLDETSARFPWELLQDRWSQSARPPSVAHGLVRQLKTPEFRPRPAHSFNDSAFVVGNPDLEGWDRFSDLPGARREAQDVAALLKNFGFRVLEHIDEQADTILTGLHRDAWRILHLAGHGEHEFELLDPGPRTDRAAGERISGMVIGKGMFLTPGDVKQMRWVPELVFINCCHLGKTQAGIGDRRYNRLAANLAIQFIEMGVKAVVAAGWAVNDAAAKAFAASFYRHMHAGDPFGEAVRAAREEIWARYPSSNTWGAYQCYGDPSYQLRPNDAGGAPREPQPYLTPAELVSDLRNATERVRMESREPGDYTPAGGEMGERIASLLARIPGSKRDAWLERADVASAVGFAWGEIGAFAKALEWLDRAVQTGVGDCPIRAIELSANFRARLAAEKWNELRLSLGDSALESLRSDLIKQIKTAIASLDSLGPTEERLNLLGSAWKRLAWVQTEPHRLEALEKMAHYYGQAFERSGKQDPYPFTNWAAAKLLTKKLEPGWGGSWENTLAMECDRLVAAARKRDAEEPSFWNSIVEANFEVVRLLTQSRKSRASERIVDNAIGHYRAAARRGASPRQMTSVRDHLDFVIALSESERQSLRHELSLIRDAL